MNTQRAIWWNNRWLDVHICEYSDGSIRIDLTHEEHGIEGLPYACLTRAFPSNTIEPYTPEDTYGMALIKSFDDNTGVLECLINAGIVRAPKHGDLIVPCGDHNLIACRVDYEILAEWAMDKQFDDFIDRKEEIHKPTLYKRRK